jgi:hypothetical protein
LNIYNLLININSNDVTKYLISDSFNLFLSYNYEHKLNFKLKYSKSSSDVYYRERDIVQVFFDSELIFYGYLIKYNTFVFDSNSDFYVYSFECVSTFYLYYTNSVNVRYYYEDENSYNARAIVLDTLSSIYDEGVTPVSVGLGIYFYEDYIDYGVTLKQLYDELSSLSGYIWYTNNLKEFTFAENYVYTYMEAPSSIYEFQIDYNIKDYANTVMVTSSDGFIVTVSNISEVNRIGRVMKSVRVGNVYNNSNLNQIANTYLKTYDYVGIFSTFNLKNEFINPLSIFQYTNSFYDLKIIIQTVNVKIIGDSLIFTYNCSSYDEYLKRPRGYSSKSYKPEKPPKPPDSSTSPKPLPPKEDDIKDIINTVENVIDLHVWDRCVNPEFLETNFDAINLSKPFPNNGTRFFVRISNKLQEFIVGEISPIETEYYKNHCDKQMYWVVIDESSSDYHRYMSSTDPVKLVSSKYKWEAGEKELYREARRVVVRKTINEITRMSLDFKSRESQNWYPFITLGHGDESGNGVGTLYKTTNELLFTYTRKSDGREIGFKVNDDGCFYYDIIQNRWLLVGSGSTSIEDVVTSLNGTTGDMNIMAGSGINVYRFNKNIFIELDVSTIYARLNLVSTTTNTAFLTWNRFIDSDDIRMQQSFNGTIWVNSSVDKPITSSDISCTVLNLESNSTYYFRLSIGTYTNIVFGSTSNGFPIPEQGRYCAVHTNTGYLDFNASGSFFAPSNSKVICYFDGKSESFPSGRRRLSGLISGYVSFEFPDLPTPPIPQNPEDGVSGYMGQLHLESPIDFIQFREDARYIIIYFMSGNITDDINSTYLLYLFVRFVVPNSRFTSSVECPFLGFLLIEYEQDNCYFDATVHHSEPFLYKDISESEFRHMDSRYNLLFYISFEGANSSATVFLDDANLGYFIVLGGSLVLSGNIFLTPHDIENPFPWEPEFCYPIIYFRLERIIAVNILSFKTNSCIHIRNNYDFDTEIFYISEDSEIHGLETACKNVNYLSDPYSFILTGCINFLYDTIFTKSSNKFISVNHNVPYAGYYGTDDNLPYFCDDGMWIAPHFPYVCLFGDDYTVSAVVDFIRSHRVVHHPSLEHKLDGWLYTNFYKGTPEFDIIEPIAKEFGWCLEC